MIRRIVGIAHVEDLDSIPDADVRANCERKALRFGRELLVNAKSFQGRVMGRGSDMSLVVAAARKAFAG